LILKGSQGEALRSAGLRDRRALLKRGELRSKGAEGLFLRRVGSGAKGS